MATSSSSALAVIPSRDISISRDVTMADEEPEVYTVPKFVAEVYEKTKEQLRVFATQLANTEEMARLSQQQQEAIKGYHYRLEQNLAEISLDARIQNNELANFSQNRYNGLLRQCSMFEAQVQADMAILSGSTDELKIAVENLAKSQKELYEAAENSHQTLGGQISDTAEEVKREKRVRRRMETELREKAEEERIRYERELAMAHNQVAEEREDRLAACNVRGRGSLSHYIVYSESPPRWCSLAIILLLYLHHNLLLVSNRSIQNTYRLVTVAVLTLLSLSCSLERFAFEYHVNISKTRYTVTPEFHHHVRNRENGHTWFDCTPENRVRIDSQKYGRIQCKRAPDREGSTRRLRGYTRGY
jgi:hypothetical protein